MASRGDRHVHGPVRNCVRGEAPGRGAGAEEVGKQNLPGVRKARTEGRAFCFFDELQEVFKAEGKFQSTRDPKKGTHLLSVLLTEENDDIGDSGVRKGKAARGATTRWQKIASGSGLRMTQLIKKGDSLTAKPDVRRRASLDRLLTVTDFSLFDSLDGFEEYVAPLLGERLGENDLENSFSWIQGRPRLTSDFVTEVLLNNGSSISEILRDYVDWHKGKQQDTERDGTSLYEVLQAFFVDGNKRPGVVMDVDIRSLLERVVKQWLKCGENVKLRDEKELALLDAGLARVEKQGNKYLAVKIVEPLAIAAAIKLLSNGGGQDDLLRRFAEEDMESALTRPSLLGFLWEDCAYKLVKEWAQGPLSNHEFFGGRQLPHYLATKGELIAFRIENGEILEQEQKGPIARFASGDRTLESFLMDTQGAHFFHPENSAGPDLVCLLRFRVGGEKFYALVWIQMKLRETVTEWDRVLKTIEPDTFFSVKEGNKLGKWRFGRRNKVRQLIGKLNPERTCFLEMVLAWPYEVKDDEKQAAFEGTRASTKTLEPFVRVTAVVDGKFGEEVWGKEHFKHLSEVKPKKGKPQRSHAAAEAEGRLLEEQEEEGREVQGIEEEAEEEEDDMDDE